MLLKIDGGKYEQRGRDAFAVAVCILVDNSSDPSTFALPACRENAMVGNSRINPSVSWADHSHVRDRVLAVDGNARVEPDRARQSEMMFGCLCVSW